MGDGVLIVFGTRSPTYDYMAYQQNPTFRFLTGVEEPDAALIVAKNGGRVDEWLDIPGGLYADRPAHVSGIESEFRALICCELGV